MKSVYPICILLALIFSRHVVSAQVATAVPLTPIYEDYSLEDAIVDQNGAFIIHDYRESHISINEGLSWDTIVPPNNIRANENRFVRLSDGSYLFSTASWGLGTVWTYSNNVWTPLEIGGDTIYNIKHTTSYENDFYLISDQRIIKYNSTDQQIHELDALSDACEDCRSIKVTKNRFFLEQRHRDYEIFDREQNFITDAYLDDFLVTEDDRIVIFGTQYNPISTESFTTISISEDDGLSFEKILELDNAISRFETISNNKLYFRYLRYKSEAWSNGHIQSRIGSLDLDSYELATIYDGTNEYSNNKLYSDNKNIYHNIGAAIIKYEGGDFEKRKIIKGHNEQITKIEKLRRAKTGELYAMTPTFLYRSLDEGQSWAMVLDHFTTIDFDLDTSGHLHIISNDRLYKSEDKGENFERISLTTERTFIDTMQIDFPNTIVIYRNNTILINGKSDTNFNTTSDLGCADCWLYYPFASYTKPATSNSWRLSSYLIDPEFYKIFPYELFSIGLNHALWSQDVIKTKSYTVSTHYNSFTAGGRTPIRFPIGDEFGFNLNGQLIHREKTETRYSENFGYNYAPMTMAPGGNIFPSADSSSFFVIGDEEFHFLKDVDSQFQKIHLIDINKNEQIVANRHQKIYTDGIHQYLINGGMMYNIDPIRCYETTLSGQFFFDKNKNCINDTESKITADDSLRIVGENYEFNLKIERGEYEISLPPGQWILQPLLAHPYVTTCETEVTVDIVNPQNLVIDFAIQSDMDCSPQSNTVIEMDICDGDSFEGYHDSGSYSDTFLSSAGCDSTRQLVLHVYPTYDTLISIYLCDGDSFEGTTYDYYFDDNDPWAPNVIDLRPKVSQTITGCDSIVTYRVHVIHQITSRLEYKTICAGEMYQGFSESGSYYYNDNYTGCVELQLEVKAPYLLEEEIFICNGESYNGYSQTGTYEDILQDDDGCDYTRILDLHVSDAKINLAAKTICEGEEYLGYKETGTFRDTFPLSSSCDSIRILELTVNGAYIRQLNREICEGEDYQGLTETGVYLDTITTSGCGYIHEISLKVNRSSYGEQDITICQGEEYLGYTSSETFQHPYFRNTNSVGCDSFLIINLTVTPAISNSIDIEICEDEIYNGYNVSGYYLDTLQTIHSCDSIVSLNLTVLENKEVELLHSICKGEIFESYNTAGIYQDLYISSNGCDSIRTLILEVEESITNIIAAEICFGDSLEGYSTSGTYEDLYTSTIGCDSLRILELTVQPIQEEELYVEVCAGESYEDYSITGQYIDLLKTEEGCDSTRILNLDVLPVSESYEEIALCLGEEYNGVTTPGLYTQNYINHHGCDSIAHTSIVRIDRKDPICALQYDRAIKYFADTDFLELYPNPVENYLKLTVAKESRLPAEFKLYSIEKRLYTRQSIITTETEIDISGHPSGLYIAVLKNGNNSYMQKVVKL